jgi:hypothetical protein
MTAARAKREPSMSVAIAAIVKAGLCPRLERRTDGSWVLTGLPRDSVATGEDEAKDLDALMDRSLGAGDGDRE